MARSRAAAAARAAAVACLAALAVARGAADEDLVTDMPGMTFKPTYRQYSGFLQSTGQKQLHYWYFEAASNPDDKPLLAWYSGGPGCSSSLAALYENGPFLVDDDGKTVRQNPYAWNLEANMVFIDAPVGVGFSYSPDPVDYSNNDTGTARDNYNALQSFFAKFPELRARDFFVAAESYGGIYGPSLAKYIVDMNNNGTQPRINLAGLFIGNGLTSYEFNDNSIVYLAYYHNLIDDTLFSALMQYCDGNFHNSTNAQCQAALANATNTVYNIGLNFYNLYGECYHPDSDLGTYASRTATSLLFRHMPAARATIQAAASPATYSAHRLGFQVPCINSTGARTYLNTPEVRKAMHIPEASGTWTICSDTLKYTKQIMDIRPYWRALIQDGSVRLALYSGDTDFACPTLATEWAVSSLQQPITAPYAPWHQDGQVVGFSKTYKGVSFITVKGSGHMVPQFRPAPALQMITALLNNTPLS